jgi:MarR family transcriptional regulator, lower aerobic nicotinate degradation pathway regulator
VDKRETGYEIGFLLRRAHVRAAQAFAAALKPLGIEAKHFAALNELAREPHSQRVLAGLTANDKSAMVRIVDDLETAGLVTREVSARDRRMQVITLTDKGNGVLRTARANARDVATSLWGHMPADHRRQLAALLREFADGGE